MVLLFIYIFALTSIMKNIVLYIIPLLLFVFSESVSQKPTIDLLPSNHERPHPEAIVDTVYTKDTLVMKSPVKKKITTTDSGNRKGEERKESFRKKVKPQQVLIFYITALNR